MDQQRFLPDRELTFADAFIMPARSAVHSRHSVDLRTDDGTGTHVPIVAANMNAVSGRRMAETLARRGALAILPQDLPDEAVCDAIRWVKSRHVRFDTPVTVPPDRPASAIAAHMDLRAHQAVVVVEGNRAVGVVTAAALAAADPRHTAEQIMSAPLLQTEDIDPARALTALDEADAELAVIVDTAGALAGVLTARQALRSMLYQPALDRQGRLRVGAALGLNGDPGLRTKRLIDAGADVLVLDTAHGHQERMIEAVSAVREMLSQLAPEVVLVAGNVVTAEGVRDLVQAGADIVKVGIGPGAMCTTRMMTGVGRPQFSAVLECARAAREISAHVWSDGGCRHPRDVALAIAAGASNVMIGSMFAATHESPGQLRRDAAGRGFKENFGMASRRAAANRFATLLPAERARRLVFEEGVSDAKAYLRPDRPGAEDVLDEITAGLRSTLSYVGARSLPEYRARVDVRVQTSAGYLEGRPLESDPAATTMPIR
ncbi:IMP dehydrogenase [Micromonospora haikouensis]|uniref:GMP reductase n=1 Tax=Micromonospora haikouensis TaxID=686309 RepID=A0A1C4XDC4_9ACTN|nr:GuaB1 family IMP dehydrogenase-related protein [Micromonospora haikouensis]SCF06455.1 IMP dehydrogenase [Micromonospora haikouensis]